MAFPILWISALSFCSYEICLWISLGCATGFLLGILASRKGLDFQRGCTHLALSLLSSILMVLPFLNFAFSLPSIASAVLLVIGGIGAASTFTLWFQASAKTSLKTNLNYFLISFAFAAIIQAVLLALPLPLDTLTMVVTLGAPLVSLVFLQAAHHIPEDDQIGFSSDPLPKPQRRFVVGFCIITLILALFFGVSDQFPFGILGDPLPAFRISLIFNLAVCALLACWLYMHVFSAEPRPSFLVLVVVVLIALLIALFYFRNELFFLLGLLQTLRIVVILCLYFVCIALVKRGSFKPAALFCLFFFIYRAGVALGIAVGELEFTQYLLAIFPHEGIYLLSACCVILVGYMLVISSGFYREAMHRASSEKTLVLETSFIDSRCNQVGASHHLSERETEIIKLLCHGRSRRYIAESLYLSENTVKWYCHQIYQKLGIHKKQELLTLVGVGEETDIIR